MERSPATALAREASWIALAILAGCTKTELATIDLSDREGVVAFIVVLDERDEALRVTRPFGVEQGNVSFGERPQLELTAEESEAVLLELDRSALLLRHPDFVMERAEELEVELRAPPPAEVVRGVDPLRATKETAIDAAGTRLTDLLDESSLEADSARARAILSQLTLTLPIDPEHCRPTDAAFVPFGREAALISDPDRMARSLDGALLLGSRALLRTRLAVHLVDRGGAIDRLGSFEAALLGDSSFLTDFALDPTSGRLMAAVITPRGLAPSASAVVELSPTSTSIEYVRSVLELDPGELEGIAISREGRTAALGENGSVHLEEPNGSFSVRKIDDPAEDPKARTISWTDDPARPLIATSRNRIQVWDRDTDRFAAEVVVLPTEVSLHLDAIATDGAEIWTAGSGGFLMRLTGGVFERIEPKLPPRYVGCATQGGVGLFVDDILDLALYDGYAYAVLAKCSALMAIRMSDRCVSLLSVDGAEPHLLQEEVDGLRSVDVAGGEVLVTDAAGRALILSP